mgnify:CR=1 FL=1
MDAPLRTQTDLRFAASHQMSPRVRVALASRHDYVGCEGDIFRVYWCKGELLQSTLLPALPDTRRPLRDFCKGLYTCVTSSQVKLCSCYTLHTPEISRVPWHRGRKFQRLPLFSRSRNPTVVLSIPSRATAPTYS